MHRAEQLAKTATRALVALTGSLLLAASATAQTQSTPPPQAPQPTLTQQIAKTVAFITVPYAEGATTKYVTGTCFLVAVPDERLGKSMAFEYVVTNRHVATAEGVSPSQLLPKVHVRVNLSQPGGEDQAADTVITLAGGLRWYFPTDPTIDLAVLPSAPKKSIDMKPILVSMFATNEVLQSRSVTIGDSVFFVGYFSQFPGLHTADPIYRNGAIAMMPEDPILMRAEGDKKPISEHLYLADAHAFLGNSGSPLFVNVGGFRNGVVTAGGLPYYLLGVVNGFIPESADGNVIAATLEVGSKDNLHSSGVLTFVPAQELWDFLYSPLLKHQRDEAVASMQKH